MSRLDRWTPKLILSLRNYSAQDFLSDLVAGLTVGLVALPLAMAFGIASGVTPQAGLYTAVIAGFIISALGGSRVQIGGPTGAFVVIVAGIIAKFGLSGLLMVTIMAGLILIVMGLTGLGAAVEFMPRPVTIGFTNGIAVLIASTQIKDFLGLTTGTVPSEFAGRMEVVFRSLSTDRLGNARPLLSIARHHSAVAANYPPYPGNDRRTLRRHAGRSALRTPGRDDRQQIRWNSRRASGVLHPVLSSRTDPRPVPFGPHRSVARRAGESAFRRGGRQHDRDRHNPNVELVAQGVANLASPLFGGIPATGAIARTATNIRSGAKTPVAGIVHALTLLLILVVAAPLARFVPLGTLAAVLFVVAWNMGEWREIGTILRLSSADKAVWIATFALTVFADLTIAVEVGIALAALLYIHRIAQTTTVAQVTPKYIEEGRLHILQDKEVPPFVTILRIHGPFLFGTTSSLDEATADLSQFAQVVILRLRNMTALDATGLHALETLAAPPSEERTDAAPVRRPCPAGTHARPRRFH